MKNAMEENKENERQSRIGQNQDSTSSSIWCGGLPAILYGTSDKTSGRMALESEQHNSLDKVRNSPREKGVSDNDSASEADPELVTQLLALGMETLNDITDNLCLPTFRKKGIVEDSLKERELYLKSLTRTELLKLIRQSEERLRSKVTKQVKKKSLKKKVKRPPLQDLSEEYPSDVDGFLEYARRVVQDQDRSYDSASFRDFEAGLQNSIKNHFLDDDDDSDSLTSVSSAKSGYEGDITPNKHLSHHNPLLSRQAFARLQGSIAKRKSKKKDPPMDLLSLIEDPRAPLIVLSDEEYTPEDTKTTGGISSAVSAENLQDIKHGQRSTNNDDRPSSFVSDVEQNVRLRKARSDPISSTQAGSRGRTNDEYFIDPADNSLIAETSFESRTVSKRCFRKKGNRRTRRQEDDHSCSFEASNLDFSENDFDGRVADLAAILKQVDPDNLNTKNLDRAAILEKLHVIEPELYQAVVHRIESMYDLALPIPRMDDEQQDRATVANGLGSSPPSRSPQVSSLVVNTPDRVYWADHSREYESGDSFPGTKASDDKRGPVKTRNTLQTVMPRRLEMTKAGSGRPPMRAQSSTTRNEESILESRSDIALAAYVYNCKGVVATIDPHLNYEHPSDEFPSFNVSIDNGDLLVTENSVGDHSCIEPTKSLDTSALDKMIDAFLSSKVSRLHSLLHERHEIRELQKKALAGMQRAPMVAQRNEDGDSEKASTTSVKKGRALIRKFQRRREALMLSRIQEQENDCTSASKAVRFDEMSRSESTSSSPEIFLDIKGHPINELRHDDIDCSDMAVQLMDVSTSSPTKVHSTPSSSSPDSLNPRKTTMRRIKAKRKKNVSKTTGSLGRSKTHVGFKAALQESMDTAIESEVTLKTGSLTSHFTNDVRSSKKPSIISFYKKKKKQPAQYEPLQDLNTSFKACPRMNSSDMLEILAPPSPESPIREQLLDLATFETSSDIACLNEIASGSGDGEVLVFDYDTEQSGSPKKLQPDNKPEHSVAARVCIQDDTDNERKHIYTHNFDSPTSIADFFGDARPFFPEN